MPELDKSEEVPNPHNYVSALKEKMKAETVYEVSKLPPEEEPRSSPPSHEEVMIVNAKTVLEGNDEFIKHLGSCMFSGNDDRCNRHRRHAQICIWPF